MKRAVPEGERRPGWLWLRIGIWVCLWWVCGAGSASAQNVPGRVSGLVVDAQTREPLSSVQVTLLGTAQGTLTGADGRFVIDGVPAGQHRLEAQSLGYSRAVTPEVEVSTGKTSRVEVALEPAAVAVEGVTVSAQRDGGSTAALLSDRLAAAGLQDALGADQIAQSPDGNAAAALKRVPGVSVVDGKFVYVRGLGERYGGTTLNGAPMPSPIPDKKAVPLDLIPSNLLESVVTAKTYSPDQPGDYAGGLVQLKTRGFPGAEQIRFSTSVGFDSNTSLSSGLDYAGGSMDWLGFGGGARSLPLGVSPEEPIRLPSDGPARGALVEALTRPWAPVERTHVPVNQSVGVTYGNKIDVAGRSLGFIASGSYASSYATTGDLVERFYAVGHGPSLQVDYAGRSTTHEVLLGALVNASLEVGENGRVSLNTIYNRMAEDEARQLSGLYESQGPYIDAPRLRYVQNELLNSQLQGEHTLSDLGGLSLRWRAGYSRAERYEPNTRTVVRRSEEPEGPFSFFAGPSSGLVFHQDLGDDGVSGAVDTDLPITWADRSAKLSLGVSGEMRERTVYTRRFRLVPNNGGIPFDVQRLPPNELFTAERIGEGAGQFGVVESTFREDNYDATQSVFAGYAMIDVAPLPGLRLVTGARVEQARQFVEPKDLFDSPLDPLSVAELETTDLLPSLNLTYELREGMSLRAGLSRTVARPQFRELTPFLFADYYGGQVTRGNPYLERSRIVNADVRWEWLFRSGALVSVGGFYKDFSDPIEPFSLVLGSSPGATWVNTSGARLHGVELELRSDLGPLHPALQDLAFNVNLTLAESRVAGDSVTLYNPGNGEPLRLHAPVDGERPLFGQSPFVVNLGLDYRQPELGSYVSLLFNRFGRRLDSFGGAGLPDIYENGRNQLDLVLEQPLWGGLDLKFSASRLLGGEVTFEQTFPTGETVVTRQYDQGRQFSLSLSWEPTRR